MKNEFFKFSSRRILFSTVMASALLAGSPQAVFAEVDGVQTVMQSGTVKGQIVDVNGESIIGASVQVKGTGTGVISDINGNFIVNAHSNAILVVSYIGYKTQEIPLKGKTTVSVVLQEDAEMLDEVVVVGYGTQKKSTLSGSVAQVSGKETLKDKAVSNVAMALQGEVPGLIVTRSSSRPGNDGVNIKVRGDISVNNIGPMILIDGVEAFGWELAQMNPQDVESVSVLKDAAAAIYGTKAAGGVILVTTKQGSKKDGFGVRYSGNFTWSQVAETLEMQDRYGQGHIVTQDENKNPLSQYYAKYDPTDSSSWGPVLDGSMQKAWNGDTYAFSKYGNKLKDYFDTGFAQNHNVSVSNVTDKSHFRASFGSSNNKGVFPNEKLNRINLDLNAGMEMNKYLSMDGKISLSRTKAEDRPYFGTYGAIAQLMGIPNNIRLDDLKQYSTADNAHVNWTGPTAGIRNPYYVLNQRHNSDERWRAFGYYGMKINFTDWLHLSAKYAFDYYRTRIEETNAGDGINGESSIKDITDDEMNREEQNFFESNA